MAHVLSETRTMRRAMKRLFCAAAILALGSSCSEDTEPVAAVADAIVDSTSLPDTTADTAVTETATDTLPVETSTPGKCVVDETWKFDPLADGKQHALAAGADGRVHAVVQVGTALDYLVRDTSGSWSAPQRSTVTATSTGRLRMVVDGTGRIGIVAAGSSTYIERSATGTWRSESVTGLGAPVVPGIAVDTNNVIHVASGAGSAVPPVYAQRGTGAWTTLTLPAAMKGAERTEVIDLAGEVHVCSIVAAKVMCSKGDGKTAFGEPITIDGPSGFELHLEPLHLVTIGFSAGGTLAELRRGIGSMWTSWGSDRVDALHTASDTGFHASGTPYLVQAVRYGSDVGLRYTAFSPSAGAAVSHTLACDVGGDVNIEVLADGTKLVSYARKAGGVVVGVRK
jgi:hypothetical protein